MCSLPQGWGVKKLGEVCDVFTDGDWIESKHQSIEGIRLIQTGNIGFGVYKDKKDKARFISEETFSRLKCTEVLPNDLLISRLPDPVGKSCIVPDINSKMITGVDCTIVRTDDNLVSEFLLFYQMSNQYLNDVELKITGATRSRISRKNLGLINIPLPPLPEQKRIVAILEKAFTAIDQAKANTEKNLKNARELFQSKLQETFANGKLKIDNGEWEEKKLGEVITLEYGKPLDKYKRIDKGQYPVYGANGIKAKTNEYYYDKKTIIIGRKGSAGEINLTEERFWPLDVSYFVKFEKKQIDLCFLYFCLLTLNLPKLAKGVKPGINRNDVYDLIIQFPSLSEQKRIVKNLDTVSTETKKLETIYQRKITCLDELKKSILQKAFNGEL